MTTTFDAPTTFVRQVQQKVVTRKRENKSYPVYSRNKYALQWREAPKDFSDTKLLSIEEARKVITSATLEYVEDTEDFDPIMLVAPPGVGKSYTGVMVAQYLAKQGFRVLYAMPRRDYWDTIITLPHFEEELWKRWLSITSTSEEGQDVCRYKCEAKIWMEKNHRMMEMCKSLCVPDGHFYKCPYRQQGNDPTPIVAGSHNHVLTGMMTDKFDVVIIDEFPLSSVLRETHVATDKILAVNTEDSYVSKLIYKLAVFSMVGKRTEGYELLDGIYEELRYIYNRVAVEESDDWLFQKPVINNEKDIQAIRYNYLKELLEVLLPEFRAYERGEKTWLERVIVDSKGIHIYSRNVLWEQLRDSKIICLDATGMKSLYDQILDKEVRVIDAPVRGNGRIFQITTRSWGISSVLDANGNLTDQGEQLLTLIEYISNHKPLESGGFSPYNRVGVVSLKGLRPHLESRGFEDGVLMHQGGSRGSNKFVGLENPIDCVIVAGTMNPSEEALLRMYAQLYYYPENPVLSRTRKPEKKLNDQGFETYRVEREIVYPYVNEEGKQPIRIVSGFEDEDLQQLYEQITHAELTQSVGRARLKTDDGIGRDVFVLSSIPPKDYSILHKVVDDLSELYPIPENVSWWKWMDFISIAYKNDGIDLTNLARLSGLSRPTLNKYLKYFLLTMENYEITTSNSDKRRKILRKRKEN